MSACRTEKQLGQKYMLCKEALEKGVAKFVPVKTIKKKDRLPWVRNKIKKMIKKRNKAYRKMRDIRG